MITGTKISEDTVLIWSGEDATKLRESHRIVGSWIGSLPTQPKQNGYLGLPMKLLPEETTLLLEEGILQLKQYEDPLSSCEDRNKLGAMYSQLRKSEEERQLKDYLADKGGTAVSFSPFVSIHTADPVVSTLNTAKSTTTWNWPCSDDQRLKYKVFSDLWRKGYYLTTGLKYGGDYLVYDGNPIGVHSYFIAKIYSWSEDISSLSLVQDGRLGGKVKKNILLCTVKPDNDTVQYITLHWSGIS